MKKTILTAIAATAVVGLSVTPAAATVTAIPSGQQLVQFGWSDGVIHFFQTDWSTLEPLEPIVDIQNGIVGATFNPADGKIYVVDNWFDTDNQRIVAIDVTDGSTDVWTIDYGNGSNSAPYETRALAFDGDGNLWVLTNNDSGNANEVKRISLADPDTAVVAQTVDVEEYDNETLSGLAWNSVDDSFYVLSYNNKLEKLNSDGSIETPEATPTENGDDEAADLAFDANGVAWISGNYGEYIVSYVPGDPTSGSVVADGVGMEAIAILGESDAASSGLADTGIDGSSITLGSLAGVAAIASGAWFLRRREVRN